MNETEERVLWAADFAHRRVEGWEQDKDTGIWRSYRSAWRKHAERTECVDSEHERFFADLRDAVRVMEERERGRQFRVHCPVAVVDMIPRKKRKRTKATPADLECRTDRA
jgi:hypothetical protein